ncbi:MAG TPA: polysaccharide deacetylase family protein [Polyangiaceae bacterium]
MTSTTVTTGSGTTGSDLPPNPSGLPEPGAGGVAQPSGTPGNLVVLPWAGHKGAISYSFDDANSTQINNEQQLMGLGVPFTWYLQTGKQEAGNAFYQRALEAGHELGNHTQSHGSGAADSDVNQAQSFLMSQYSVVGFTMAAPNGSTNNYNNITQQLFILDRGVSDALIGPDDNTNMLNLPSWIPPQGAGTAQFNPKADAAQSQGKWQTVCIHGFTGGSDGAYQPIDLNGFLAHIDYVKEKGDVWIGTMLDVGAYFLGRKAVAAATPTTQGSDQVYTWTLPNVFPPGHYVRVTVDGGTLSQDGEVLPWNDHGFYEVALDVGSLTISP